MTTDDNYSFLSMGILTQPIVMHLFNKQKIFFLRFLNLDQFWNILKKKMTVIAYVFPKLRTTKDVVR